MCSALIARNTVWHNHWRIILSETGGDSGGSDGASDGGGQGDSGGGGDAGGR